MKDKKNSKKPSKEDNMKTMIKAHQWSDTHKHTAAFDTWLSEADRNEQRIINAVSVSIVVRIWIAIRDEFLRDFGFKE